MFCPQCRYEYVEGVRVCPDCRKNLVEALEPEPEPSDVPMVPLPNLPGRVYAEMVKGILDGHGIPCYIRGGAGIGDVYQIAGTGPVGEEVRLFVPADQYEECIRLQRSMLDHI